MGTMVLMERMFLVGTTTTGNPQITDIAINPGDYPGYYLFDNLGRG